jgi:uncharacterized membrane protein YphA (DoxX/SURF4 family)
MNTGLWMVQVLLAFAFLYSGVRKTLLYEQNRAGSTFMQVTPKQTVMIVGVLEVLGGIGVILPAVTGILPWLSPVAAIGLLLTMLGAMVFNVQHKRVGEMVANIIILILAAFVIVGRFDVIPL